MIDKLPGNNLYLTGMMGSGKTSIGKVLALYTGLKFVDVDDLIAEDAGMTIPQIFEKEGEEGFRARERAALEKTAQTPNLIVATGGGAILREENVDIMHRAGLILFIDRPVEHILEDIDFSGRPMLREGAESVRKIHEARYPLYRQRCDVILDNRYEDEDDAAQMVLRLFQTDRM